MKSKVKIPDIERIRMMRSTGMPEKDAVMKMADMKRVEKAEKESKAEHATAVDKREDYPYGLRIELDHEGMKKLGMKKMPKVGSTHMIKSRAKVMSSNESSSEGDKTPRRSVSMQMTHMQCCEDDSQDSGLEDQ